MGFDSFVCDNMKMYQILYTDVQYPHISPLLTDVSTLVLLNVFSYEVNTWGILAISYNTLNYTLKCNFIPQPTLSLHNELIQFELWGINGFVWEICLKHRPAVYTWCMVVYDGGE